MPPGHKIAFMIWKRFHFFSIRFLPQSCIWFQPGDGCLYFRKNGFRFERAKRESKSRAIIITQAHAMAAKENSQDFRRFLVCFVH